MEALRELGYDSYDSILDLIDNSLDADASNVQVTVEAKKGDIVISILDDGDGMSRETLSEALRLGSETDRESGDLGKFGMGLVTASIGLSRCVEVTTRLQGGRTFFGRFDLDEIAETNEFRKWVGEAAPDPELDESGTRVRLSKTDRIKNRNITTFANTLRKRIGQTFRKFLKTGERKISVNGQWAEAFDPLMLSHAQTLITLEPTELRVDGKVVATVRCVELPDLGAAGNSAAGIISNNAGFYIVRNNREIVSADSFGFFSHHPSYAHFRAEVSFDGIADDVFHTDVKKATIHPEQSLLDQLRQLTAALITQAARNDKKRANENRGKMDHSIVEALVPRRASVIPKPPTFLEKRQPRGKKGSHEKGNGDRSRTPFRTELKTPAGLRVEFREGDYGEAPFYLVSQEGQKLIITYNREHPYWRELEPLGDQPKVVANIDILVVALAVAELMMPEQAQAIKTNMHSTLVGLLY
jgi:hypothetical protein